MDAYICKNIGGLDHKCIGANLECVYCGCQCTRVGGKVLCTVPQIREGD